MLFNVRTQEEEMDKLIEMLIKIKETLNLFVSPLIGIF